jgi:hypothetical protein
MSGKDAFGAIASLRSRSKHKAWGGAQLFIIMTYFTKGYQDILYS